MKYQSKLLLLSLFTALSQVSYTGMKDVLESQITENSFEIIESEGFGVKEDKKSGVVVAGSLGPQFIAEYKKQPNGAKNRSYQFSPVVGIIALPEYDLSTTLEVKRNINRWSPKSGSDQVGKSWEFQIQPRYYLGYYLGAPTDLVGEINIIDEKRPWMDGIYKETEFFIGFAQRRPNLYAEVRYAHLRTRTDDDYNNNIKTFGDGFDINIKPFVQKGPWQFESEFYHKLQERWNVPDGWGQTYTEYHITPGIIYDFGGGKKLSFRNEFGIKTQKNKNSDYKSDLYYWKATLGYEFMVTQDLGGLIEVEFEKDRTEDNYGKRKEYIRKVTAGLNYRF